MKYKSSLIYPVFAVIIFTILCICNSWKVFNYPPKSVHQWRQSDCAAYVKTYYRNGSSLMQPATYNLAGKEGRVISEFPIIYYTAAKLQHLLGEHYWIVRGLTFLSFIVGLIALLAITRRWVKHPVLAIFPVVLLLTSPYYYYYSINFLPNIPAISFSFVGLFFFLKYIDKKKVYSLIWGTLFFILATALKPTDGGILWLAFVGTVICTAFTESPNNKKLLVPLLLSFILIAICIIAWARYVTWYNDLNGNHQNLIGIHPIWDMDKDLMMYTAKRVLTEWSNVFQQKAVLLCMIAFLIGFIWKWKQLNVLLKWFTIWTIAGTVLYSILWFKAYTDHDYYQIPLMLPLVCLSITVLAYFEKDILTSMNKITRRISYVILILLMIVGLYHNRNIQKERYATPDFIYTNPALYEIEPYLDSIGVKQDDAVVCVPDKSPNISLNAINRYGYSEEFNSSSYNIYTFKSQGASYLIISDSSYLHNPLYAPFVKREIGKYKGVHVFDIR